MNLRKLPPTMLLALGLACGGDDDPTGEASVSACLTPPYPETEIGSCLSATTGLTTGSSTSGADSTFGPCLSPPEPTTDTDSSSSTGTGSDTGTDTGSDTGSDTGTGSDSGSGTDGTTGMMGDQRPPTRAAAVERVLERGTLPPDVAARLRNTVR